MRGVIGHLARWIAFHAGSPDAVRTGPPASILIVSTQAETESSAAAD